LAWPSRWGRAGEDVVINYVSGDEAAQRVVEEIQQNDVRAYAHKADVSREDQVQTMFSAHVRRVWHHRHSDQQCRTATRCGL
jgi:NAD(P)-dependent dehydrogenase (short-subunit alcohol dehydrogenase family)